MRPRRANRAILGCSWSLCDGRGSNWSGNESSRAIELRGVGTRGLGPGAGRTDEVDAGWYGTGFEMVQGRFVLNGCRAAVGARSGRNPGGSVLCRSGAAYGSEPKSESLEMLSSGCRGWYAMWPAALRRRAFGRRYVGWCGMRGWIWANAPSEVDAAGGGDRLLRLAPPAP